MKSITALKQRCYIFQKQFAQTSLFLLQVTQHCLTEHIPEFKEKKSSLPLIKVRDILEKNRNNKVIYNDFYNFTKKKFPLLDALIEWTIATQVECCKLEDFVSKNQFGTYVNEPLNMLWIFLLELFYIKPRLLLNETDDLDGKNVSIVRDSLPDFLAHCMNLQFSKGPTLTALSLKSLGDEPLSNNPSVDGESQSDQSMATQHQKPKSQIGDEPPRKIRVLFPS